MDKQCYGWLSAAEGGAREGVGSAERDERNELTRLCGWPSRVEIAVAKVEARRRESLAEEEHAELRSLLPLQHNRRCLSARIATLERGLLPDHPDLERIEAELREAHQRQERELLSAALLAATGAAAEGPLREWQQSLAEEAGLGAGATLSEAIALASLGGIESFEERDEAVARLRDAMRLLPVSSLQGGFAAAAVAELPPVRDAAALQSSPSEDAAAEDRVRATRELDGFAARQQQGAFEGVTTTRAEPEAVRRRREGLLPAFSERTAAEWRLARAPADRPLKDAVAGYGAGLRSVIDCIERGVPREAGSRAVDFIFDLPDRLGEALPEAQLWFTNEHVTTTQVYRERKILIAHRNGPWVRLDTGLLNMLKGVLRHVEEQLQWAERNNVWADFSAVPALVAAAKEGDEQLARLSTKGPSREERLAVLAQDAEHTVRSLLALLQHWDTQAALELTVTGFFYTANLSPQRFDPEIFDQKGKPVPGYTGPLTRNTECQLFYWWNKALREHTDPDWPLPVTPEQREINRRVVEVFEPMSYLLTELIRSLASAGEAPTVSRGISFRVSDMYESGTAVALAQFTSTSMDDRLSQKFAGEAGTWLKMQVHNAASVSWCSQYPAERELLLPPGTVCEVGFKFGGTLLMLLESRRDLVFVCEWSDTERSLHETVDQRCRTLKESALLFEDFSRRFVEPLCDTYEGDAQQPLHTSRPLFEVFREFLASDDVHLMVLVGGGGIGKSCSLAALMREASLTADWVPYFDGLHQIDGLLGCPGAPHEPGCYLAHLRRRVLQCRDADAALQLFMRRRLFHALDSLDEAAGELPRERPLLESMGLLAGPGNKVGISTRPEHLQQQGIAAADLHRGRVLRVELRGFGDAEAQRFAELSAEAWHSRAKGAGCTVEAAVGRACEGIVALREADPALARTPFAVKIAADLALAERIPRQGAGGGLMWHLMSEWVQLQVAEAAPRFSRLSSLPLTDVGAMAARVALALCALLLLTGEWQGVLAHFAALLRRPSLLTDPAPGSSVPEPRFSPPLRAEERAELRAHLESLLEGVPPQRVRDLLGILPLRLEHLDSPSGLFSFRHKMVAEWVAALWLALPLALPAAAAPECPALLSRLMSPHCWDSQQLVLRQLCAAVDPGLLRRAAEQAEGQQQPAGAGALPAADGLNEPSMPERLALMAAVKNKTERPGPLPVSEGWVRGEFAAAVMQQYDAARRGALSRRQLGTLWSVAVLGQPDRPLSAAEWAAERPVRQGGKADYHLGAPPSVLQGARMGGGAPASDAAKLSAGEVGCWLWALVEWLCGPSTRFTRAENELRCHEQMPCYRLGANVNGDGFPVAVEGLPAAGLGHALAKGLLRLWQGAAEARRPWTVQRVAGELCARAAAEARRGAGRRSPSAGRGRAERLLGLARYAALLPAERTAVLELLAAAVSVRPEEQPVPLRRGAAAEPAAAFRAAAAACAAESPQGQSAQPLLQLLLAECWAGRGGQWAAPGRLLCPAAEPLRRARAAAACTALEGGETGLSVGGWSPSAAQLLQLAAAARGGGALRVVRAEGCPRLGEGGAAAALLQITASELHIKGSPLAAGAQGELLGQLLQLAAAARGGGALRVVRAEGCPRLGEGGAAAALLQITASELHIKGSPLAAGAQGELCAKLGAGGDEMVVEKWALSGGQLGELCEAARAGEALRMIKVGFEAAVRSVAELEWVQLVELVRDCPSVKSVWMTGCSMPLWLRQRVERVLQPDRKGNPSDEFGWRGTRAKEMEKAGVAEWW
eukprot:TRINITY_DN8550_c1_g1_i2.p1 TRINITY_DN8550_c1_g1~~TRINITY_DN8550_c1_g1_i2.p1  ORF type:complete len:1769 (+),score=593.13 TRINITY_DN8550_c1_g1_i2:90-5396(+)